METYKSLVDAHPIIMAIIQFAILGTLGEIISKWIINKKLSMPFSIALTLWKMVVWSILAVCIKYAFVGYPGYVDNLIESKYHLLPQIFAANTDHTLPRAFAISATMNLQFGMLLILFHRFLDNLVIKVKNWKGIDKAIYSLLWFWIPAHTVTFILPENYRIGLAALWSVVLGLILGFFNRKKV